MSIDEDLAHKAGRLLSALLDGHRVTVGGRVYLIGEITAGDQAGMVDVCVEGERIRLGSSSMPSGEPCLLRVGMGVTEFVELARKMNEDEWALFAAEATLTGLKREGKA